MTTTSISEGSLSVFGIDLTKSKLGIILCVFSFLLYANTLGHEYTQDDAIVIYDNMYVEQGIKGIPGLLSKDTFFGFFKVEGKANLVSGGRYRPLTPIMFAIEWQIFGNNPFIGHLINILLYALLVLVLFRTLALLFNDKSFSNNGLFIAFGTALLFAAHPIHTEAVANIKGRDEIVALLASIFCLYLILKNIERPSLKLSLYTGIVFFLGLLSKENTITYLAVVPLALILFRDQSWLKAAGKTLPLFLGTIVFLMLRTYVLGTDFGNTPMELMNNPFIKIENNVYVPFDLSEKFATITYTLGKYINLMFFPHPLTHDYYPRHVDMMSWTDPAVIFSILMYLVMIATSFLYFKKNRLTSFSILYFLITLSIVSNVVFPIGTNMSERFMFMPSVGFSLFIVALLEKVFKKRNTAYLILSVLVLALGLKTILRNPVWKSDYTLFTTDVQTSKRSAKLLNAAGGAISTNAYTLSEGPQKTKDLQKAVGYLNQAVQIHPNYKNAYLLLGNAYYYLKEYDNSIMNYDHALSVAPGYEEARKNLIITLRDAGRYYGEQKGDIPSAFKYLKRAHQMDSSDFETVRLLGVASGISGNTNDAIKYFTECVSLKPNFAQSYVNLGTALRSAGQSEKAEENFQKALSLDPEALNHLRQ